MLHNISSVFFVLAIILYLAKYIKIFKNKILLKSHIVCGVISCISMSLYAILDYLKEKESFILIFIPIMIFIILTGTKDFRKKYKFMHIASVMSFCIALAIHIIL
ncbi:MAG: hypothetical protein ACRC3Y_03750 [Romboutsia sp.]|uniref:hypothetical protein n=1 Tax=Romboutsia sp. TaxID=1965302 RepID=UPI003F378375